MPILQFPDVGSLGQHRDALAYEVPDGAWSTGNNVRFRNGYAERSLGHSAVFDPPSVAPYGVFGGWLNATRYLVYCGLAKIYAVTGATHTEVTPTSPPTGTAADIWTGGVLPGGIMVVNNGKDVPWYWIGTTASDFATLTDWTATTVVKSMRVHKNYLFACNVNKNGTKYERMLKWSTAADVGSLPAEWVPAADNDANERDLDVSTPLVDMISYGDNLYIFSEKETVVAQYIGPPFIFRTETISRTNGLLAQRCAAVVPGGVFAVGAGDIVLHNGTDSPPSLIDGRMKAFFYADLSATYYPRTFVVRNQAMQEVWVCYPSTGSTGACDRALIWNYAANTWTVRDLPSVHAGCESVIAEAAGTTWTTITGTWTTGTGTWESYEVTPQTSERVVLASGTATKLFAMDAGDDFNGTSFTALIERTGLSLGDPDRFKLVRGIRPRIDADAGTVVNVYVGGSKDPEGDVSWSGPFTYTVGADTPKIDCLVSGRYIGVRFQTTEDAQWRLRSYAVDFEFVGAY